MKPKTDLPELTGLQFLVIDIIRAREMRGAEVRQHLKENKIFKTGPAFYQLMARLEEAKFVEGWYEQEIVEGQILKRRVYRVTGLGERAYHKTQSFYSESYGKGVAYATS